MFGNYNVTTGVRKVEEPMTGDVVMIVSPTQQNYRRGLFAQFGDLAVVMSLGAASALVQSEFLEARMEYDFAITLLTGENKGHVYGVYRDEIAVTHGFIRVQTVDVTVEQSDRYADSEMVNFAEPEPASCRR